jgi:hypothetical protein
VAPHQTPGDGGEVASKPARPLPHPEPEKTISVAKEPSAKPTPEPAATPTPAARPAIVALEPADGAVFRSGSVTVRGRAEHDVARVTVNGKQARLGAGGAFTADVPAAARISVRASGPGGDDEREVRLAIDDDRPEVRPELPPQSIVADERVVLAGEVRDAHPGRSVAVNGVSEPAPGGRFRVERRLAPGRNEFVIAATDAAGNTGEARVVLVLDRDPPTLELTQPDAELFTSAAETLFTGRVVDANPAAVEIGASRFEVAADGAFSQRVPLADGENAIDVRAVDAAGNRSLTARRRIVRDAHPPALAPDAPPARILPGKFDLTGTVDKDGCTIEVDGVPAAREGRRFRASFTLDATRTFAVVARDRAGNEARASVTVVVAADLGDILRVDAAMNRVVVRLEARGGVKAGDLVEALHAGRPVGRLKVARLLPPAADAPEGCFSCEPDRGGTTEPFHAGDRVRSVNE